MSGLKTQAMGRILAGIREKQARLLRLARIRRGTAGETDFRVAAAGDVVEVYIFDVIGWPYIEAQDLLYRIPKNAGSIKVFINSPGGDVFEGMTIYNLLKDHPARVEIVISGLAASSASLIAMAGDRIRMAEASFLMIHNPYSYLAGDADELRKEADLLDKISNTFADAYAGRTGNDRDGILAMMKAETWLTPAEAVDKGFADEAAGGASGVDIAARYDLSVFENVPQFIRQGSVNGRQTRAQTITSDSEENMNKKIRALLERLGLAKDADEEQALQFLAALDLDTIEDQKDRDRLARARETELIVPLQSVGAQARQTEPVNQAVDQADVDAAVRQAVKAERERAGTIRGDVRTAGLPEAFGQDLIDRDVSVDAARAAIMAEMGKTNPPMGAGRFSVGEGDNEKFRAAVIDGVLFRTHARAEKPAPGFETFRAASIEFIARQCLERIGVSTAGMASRNQIAAEILRRSAMGGGLSTSDFTSIFMDVAHKTMLKAYQESPSTWRPIVNVVPASDFKTIYGVSLSEAPDLDLITEKGEYKEGKLSDNQENYSVGTYGKVIYLTRTMIVNDDLRAFVRLPQLLGSAARRKESDLVWGLITGNPAMTDGKTLFHADHNNLEAASVGVVDTDKLDAGRVSMRKQKGLGGATLDIRPAFLAVPVAQETAVDVILRSAALPAADMSAGVHNPWAGKLTPISDPRLDENSVKAWYLVGDPAQVDTIEVAYLDGNEQPYTEEHAEFIRDAVGYKIRHDFGCGVMDTRGLYKNPGE